MSLETRIKYSSLLTPAELQFGTYLLRHAADIAHSSMQQVLAAAFISRSMFYRFCKKLEIDGFNELKILLLEDSEQQKKLSQVDVNFPFSAMDCQQSIAEKLKKLYADTIQDTLNALDPEELRCSVLTLHKAKDIAIYAAPPNSLAAESFQYKMLSIGRSAHAHSTGYMQLAQASLAAPNQAAIILSYSGKACFIPRILPLLQAQGTPIIWIGRPGNPSLEHAVQQHLFISARENFRERLSQFSSQTAMQYVMDLLFSCIFKLDYDKNMAYLRAHNQLNDNRPI